MIPRRFQPLTTGRSGRAARNAGFHFLLDLWAEYDPDAYTFVGTKWGDHWRDHPIRGDRASQLDEILDAYPAQRHDLYFCPNAFSEPHRKSIHALSSCYAQCDIDDADPNGYDPRPNILWETSPSRFQGLWIWREEAPAAVAEQYSKNIWAKDGGDKGGWSSTKMLRLPGSLNHKPIYRRPVVTLRAFSSEPQRLPKSIAKIESARSRPRSSDTIPARGDDVATIMRRYRRAMGMEAGTLMTARRMLRADRSGAVFMIIATMIEVGAPDADIVTVLLANPYFLSKWGADRAQAEDQVARIRVRLGAGR